MSRLFSYDMEFPLTTINSEVAIEICANECGSKCCDMYLNDFHVRVNHEDFSKLKRYNLTQFVVWDHGDPQLAKRPGGKCIFLDPRNKICSIYPIRPLDCRNFPYHMPENEIPDFCVLYHNSSRELKIEQRNITREAPQLDERPEELTDDQQLYLKKLQNQPTMSLEHLENEVILESDTGYYSVVYSHEEDLEKAEKQIDTYEEELQEKAYYIFSIIGMNDDQIPVYHILGAYRKNRDVEIPDIATFPPQETELEEALHWVNNNAFDHLIAGIILPYSVYDNFEKSTSISKSDPALST